MFTDFAFSPSLLKTLDDKKIQQPTAVQEKVIPAVLNGQDVLAGAETGSGKTIAYLLPLFQQLIERRKKNVASWGKGNHIKSLILVPTRELAQQIRDEALLFARNVYPPLSCKMVVGGHDLESQIRNIKTGADVLVATPARISRLLENKAIRLSKLKTVVVDEADKMVSQSFRTELTLVLEALPQERQSLLLTATLPDSLRWLVRVLLNDPVVINIEESEGKREEFVINTNRNQKIALLDSLLNTEDWRQVLVFATSKKTCDRVYKQLSELRNDVGVLHSNLPQKIRSENISLFKKGQLRVLISTDVVARGLDIEDLPCVISVELPREVNSYTHRIGRTARAGRSGTAISIVSPDEFAHLSAIERSQGIQLERITMEGFELKQLEVPAKKTVKNKKKKSRKRKG